MSQNNNSNNIPVSEVYWSLVEKADKKFSKIRDLPYYERNRINYYQEGDQVHPRLEVSTAFPRALLTWASWVDKYTNLRKTQVFFRSSAPTHFRGGQWNSGGHFMEAPQLFKIVVTGVFLVFLIAGMNYCIFICN